MATGFLNVSARAGERIREAYVRNVASRQRFPLVPAHPPKGLITSLTTRCNLHCRMCAAHSPLLAEHQTFMDLPDALFEKMLPIISHADKIMLAVRGEPLVAVKAVERMAAIKKINPNIHIGIITNGILLAQKPFAERALVLLDEIHLSLNGVDTYESIMHGSHWQMVADAARNIREVRARTGQPKQVSVGFILMRRNLGDMEAATRFTRDNGFDEILFKDLWVTYPEFLNDSIRHDPDLFQKAYTEARRLAEMGFPVRCEPWPEIVGRGELSGAVDSSPPVVPLPLRRLGGFLKRKAARPARALKWMLLDPKLFVKKVQRYSHRIFNSYQPSDSQDFDQQPPCTSPWNQVLVEVDGETRFCCEGKTIIGNLNTESFETIWNGDEARRYREEMAAGRGYKVCATCVRMQQAKANYEKYK